MLTAARRIRFTIVNPKIVHNKNQIKNDPRLSFYPVVGFKQTKTGAMTLNKPDNNNNVTLECADELFRFLTSYQHDHTVENVWIQNRGPAFSGGADYEELRNNSHYLDKLMRLSVMVAQFNKPIFAKVHGSVRGISAYLLTMFSTPLGTDKSTLRLDETSRGFIPIFGGSQRLSRLPCNIGLYLALTGDKLNAEQMAKLGFLKGAVNDDQCTNKTIRKHISNANLFHRFPYGPSSHGISEIKKENLILYKMNYFYDFISETQKELFKTQANFYSKLALNQYRIAQTQYYNILNPYNSFSPTNLFVNNHFARKHDIAFNYLKEKQIFEQAKTDYNVLARLPVHKLIKVFSHDTLQEALEELSKDKSDWARKTQEMIRQKDPLAAQLTFHLIKNAKDLTFIEALQEQYKVARRLLNISEIKIRQISENRSVQVLQSKYSSKKIEDIPKQTIQQFFRPYQTESEIFDHDSPKHSLLPTTDYWRQVPDAGRNYLNGTFFEDIHAKFGEIQVRRFLHGLKINYKDRSFNLPTLRQYVHKKYHYEKLIDLEKQRLKGILQSEIFYSNLKQQRIKYVQQRTKDPQFSKLIEEQIRNYFDTKFRTRFNDLEKTAKIAGKEQRMSTIRKYVNTLIENIVYNGRKIEDQMKAGNLTHEGIVRFDNKGSDVFHAETPHEKTVAQFNVLKEAYKDGKSIQKLQKMDPNKLKTQNQFFKAPLSDYQYDLIKKDAALRLNYNKTILPLQIALKYKQLIKRASTTSQQIANLMGWETNDIQTMLFNAPAFKQTFRQFSEQVIERAPKIEERVEQLNKLYNEIQQSTKLSLPDLLKGEEKPSHKNIFFNTQIIPRPFREAHLPILDQTIKFFSSKYEINGQMHPSYDQKNKSVLNQWVSQGLKSNYSKLMKSDVEYVFSYLIIIHLKQMLAETQKENANRIQKVIQLMQQKYGINLNGLNENQFNAMFMNYLYAVLDMHEQSKHRIIFPQTKMIQFIKRLKMSRQLQDPYMTYSFESLMQLIAKDRKRIRDMADDIVPILGYDPQVTLNTVTTQQQQNKGALPPYRQIFGLSEQELMQHPGLFPIDTMKELTSNKQTHMESNKNLVVGFVYYLRRFQAMMHKVAGRTMFLPKQLYECKEKQTYKNLKQLLRIQLNDEEWFKLKLRSAITHVFDFRFEQEKSMSEGELRLFDEEFSQLFTPEIITLLMKYQTYSEQSIAKILLGADKNPQQTNENIKSNYLDFKNQIKNPKALKMLNNLIMTKNVIQDRIDELEELRGRRDQSLQSTAEETKQLDYQRTRWIYKRTVERLSGEALRFADEDPHFVQKPQFYQNHVLRFVNYKDRKPTRFLQELKEIKNILDQKDLKSELDNRISRIQALRQ